MELLIFFLGFNFMLGSSESCCHLCAHVHNKLQMQAPSVQKWDQGLCDF